MKGFERYQSAILGAMTVSIKPLMDNSKHTKAAGEVLWNHLFDLPGPRQVNRQPCPSELYLGGVFDGFLEISKSLETLEDIRSLIGRPPERRPPLPEDRYLQVLAEAYLNELYLLRERLRKYGRFVQRAFSRDAKSSHVRAETTAIIRAVDVSLEPFLQTRHVHTHKHRFTDEGISRLGTIRLLMLGDDPNFKTAMEGYYHAEQAKVKKHWRDTMTKTNSGIRKTADTFLDRLFPLVFNEDSEQLLLPAKFTLANP